MDHDAADENSNSSFSMRKRKSSLSSRQENPEKKESRSRDVTPSARNNSGDEAVDNVAIYQEIALTRIKNHAVVSNCSLLWRT